MIRVTRPTLVTLSTALAATYSETRFLIENESLSLLPTVILVLAIIAALFLLLIMLARLRRGAAWTRSKETRWAAWEDAIVSLRRGTPR